MADAEVLLDAIALVAEPIRISSLWRPMLPDPGDDLVLETAVNGRAEVVVTFNRRDFAPASARFAFEIVAGRRCATTGESLMKKSKTIGTIRAARLTECPVLRPAPPATAQISGPSRADCGSATVPCTDAAASPASTGA
jgi:hypothetical protein